MKKNFLVTILISNYNKQKYIKKCLESCLYQSYKNLEIIVCDNNSTDNSKKIISIYPEIKLIKQKRNSDYSSVNQTRCIKKGLRIAKGDYIFLLDSDDFFEKKKVFKVVEYLNKKRCDFIQDKSYLIFKNKKKKLILKKNYFSIWPRFYNTSTMVFERKYLNFLFRHVIDTKIPLVEIDTQVFLYQFFFKKNLNLLKNYLTNYRLHNENLMKNFPFLSLSWWIRRYYVYKFFFSLSDKEKKDVPLKLDYIFALVIFYSCKFFKISMKI